MNKRTDCPICLMAPLADAEDLGHDVTRYICQRCGAFEATATALEVLSSVTDLKKRMRLSVAVRAAHEAGESLKITSYWVAGVLGEEEPPRLSLFDSVDRFLLYLAGRADRPFKSITYNMVYDFTSLGFTSEDEMQDAANAARELEYLTPNALQITLAGWRRVEELRSTRRDSRKAFVAMWFDPEMDEARDKGFKLGILDTDYFEPVIMSELEHDGKIDDRIIAEIRTAGLVVADFTGGRGGVYYEAGFAQGLGISVIWTCRSDHFDNLHFDTRQYNHIRWENPPDLREQLKNRILARMSKGAAR